MAVLNLRSVPDELYKRLKVAAANNGEPFHSFCVGLLQTALLHGLHLQITAAPKVTVHPPIEVDLPPGTAPKVADVRYDSAAAVRSCDEAIEAAMRVAKAWREQMAAPADSASRDIEIT